jgi:hypothetical protein
MRLRWFATAAVAVSVAMPASAETLWVGNVLVTAATDQCGSAAEEGGYFRSVYRPAGVPLGNGANSYLTYLGQRSSYAMTVPNNQFQFGVNYTASGVTSEIKIVSKAGGITQWVQNPVSVSTNTTFITVTASIANFFAVTGCTATFQGHYVRVP